MPRVNPEIMVWARETAGLTQEEAAKKLGFQDRPRSSAVEKLTAVERGQKEPSRPQLLRMAEQYRRPLLTFYLSKPPVTGDRGVDFRTLPKDYPASDEALLDALIRDIRARQSMVRVILEDEEEAELLPFVGSHRIEDGRATVLRSLKSLLRLDSAASGGYSQANVARDQTTQRAQTQTLATWRNSPGSGRSRLRRKAGNALAAVLTGFRTRLHQIGCRQIAAGMRGVPPPGAVGSVSRGKGQRSQTD